MSAGKSDVEQAREWSERLTSAHTQRRRRARAGMWLTDLQVPALAALLTRMADALATREPDRCEHGKPDTGNGECRKCDAVAGEMYAAEVLGKPELAGDEARLRDLAERLNQFQRSTSDIERALREAVAPYAAELKAVRDECAHQCRLAESRLDSYREAEARIEADAALLGRAEKLLKTCTPESFDTAHREWRIERANLLADLAARRER